MRKIKKDWVYPLYYGSIILSSGGVEDAISFALEFEKLLTGGKWIPLLNLEELEYGAEYSSFGILGSLIVAQNPVAEDGLRTVSEFERRFKRKISGLFSLEMASVNVFSHLMAACLLDLPVIDGDCMGRAFPEFQMNTAHIAGYSMAPGIITSKIGNIYEFQDEDDFMYEQKARKIVDQEGGNAFFNGLVSKEKELKDFIIPGTLSFAYDIGKAFVKPASYNSLLEELIFVSKNSVYGAIIELFVGIVKEMGPADEVSWSSFEIEGIGNYSQSKFRIFMQNEALIAYRDRDIVAMVPDLIALVNRNTLKPINGNQVKVGHKVSVFGIPAPVILKTKKALSIVSPKSFGYKNKFESLEQLNYAYYF